MTLPEPTDSRYTIVRPAGLTTWRLLGGRSATARDFRPGDGMRARRAPQEDILIFAGLSAFLTLSAARSRSTRPRTFIARLELDDDTGTIVIARTFSRAHVSVWGAPDALLACVADVTEVA